MTIYRNGSAPMNGSVNNIPYKALGKLGLDPDTIPKRFCFVKEPYSAVLLESVRREYDRSGIAGIPKGIGKGLERVGAKFFYINSQNGKDIIQNPGGWKALDNLYKNEPVTQWDEWIENLPASKATVQRFLLYKNLQEEAIIESLSRHGESNHAELFSGATRAPLETYKKILDEDPGIDIGQFRLECFDIDRRAKDETMRLAQEMGLSEMVIFHHTNVKNAPDVLKGKYGIIASHGGFDYLGDEEIVEFTTELSGFQEPGDYFFSTNMLRPIDHRDWKALFCMRKFGGWDNIIERPPGKAGRLISETGKYSTESFITTPDGYYLYDESDGFPYTFKRKVHEVVRGKRKQDSIELRA